MLPPGLYTIPWAHSLSSDVPYNFYVCAPRLLHPTFSDVQDVLPCLYEPSSTLLGTILSAWSLHLAAYLSALTDTASMLHNCFRLRNRGRAYHLCSMSFPTVESSICMFFIGHILKVYMEYGVIEYLKGLYLFLFEFFSNKYSYPNANVSSVASPYIKSSKLVNDE